MLFNIIHRSYCVDKLSSTYLNILKNRYLIPLCHRKSYVTDKLDPTKLATAGTMKDVKARLIKILGISKGYHPNAQEERGHLNEYLPTNQKDLPPRTMNDSFVSAILPISTNFELQDRYTTVLGRLRIGRLLEDMDLFAVYVAYSHLDNPKLPPNIPVPHVFVTALVDKIDFTDFYPTHEEDVRLSGHVSWVGQSSVEVVVWLEQKKSGQWNRITRALFLMAARDAMTNKSAIVNPLVPTNDEEKKILDNGEARKKNRVASAQRRLNKVIASAEEQKIMHDVFLRTVDINDISLEKRHLPEGCMWMRDCKLTNIVFSHPEDRNLHNNVFGGFIMRHAVELSFGLGYLFSSHRPVLKTMSDITFNRPVQMNSLIRMVAHVVFAQKRFFEITAYADTLVAKTKEDITTNAFHFTFEVPEDVSDVYPYTYQEVMMYLDGLRHHSKAIIKKN